MATVKSTKKSSCDIKALVRAYVKCRDQKKLLEERLKEMGAQIKEYALANGTKDSKGSYYLSDDQYTYGMQARKSIKLDPEKALTFCKKNKYTMCIRQREEIDEDALSRLVADGTITEKDLTSISSEKVTQSIYVSEREETEEEMPEVQQTKAVKAQSSGSKIRRVKR